MASLCRLALVCLLFGLPGGSLAVKVRQGAHHGDRHGHRAGHRPAPHGPWSPLTEGQKNASLKVWLKDYEKSSEWVDKLPVVPAKDTDRVAVTILQPATPEKVKLMAHIIKLNMYRLGPKWGLAVYYCKEEEKEALSEALGRPENVVWAPIFLRRSNASQPERIPELGRIQFSYYLLSMDFWKMIPEKMENILIFGDDSIVLKGNGCIDKFIGYDYVGAPWHPDQKNMPRYGGNGGFRLVRRSSSVASISGATPLISKMRGVAPGRQRVHEDEAFVKLLHDMNGSFPDREAAASFAVETVMHPDPCAIHKPWLYQNVSNMHLLLNSADLD